jgi:fatty acid desaturase
MNAHSDRRGAAHNFKPHWVSQAAYPIVVSFLGLTEAGLALALYYEHYWLAVPLVLLASHLMHGALIGFHEASHGLLRKNRRWNELDGISVGVFSLVSFSLYRAAHQTHHAHLGSERDEEFWPFVQPQTPRWARILAAFMELFCALLFTPLLFMRSFLRKGSPIRSPRVRRRIWAEIILTVVIWSSVLVAVAWFGLWRYFLWMYLLPAWIAANLQSWRKYIEHMGLTGSTVRSATRSIVADGFWGRLVSFTLLHEPYHGVHHQRGGLTHAELPAYTDDLQPSNDEEHPPFASYTHALKHLVVSLKDPKVGPQWQGVRDGGASFEPARERLGHESHAEPDASLSASS